MEGTTLAICDIGAEWRLMLLRYFFFTRDWDWDWDSEPQAICFMYVPNAYHDEIP